MTATLIEANPPAVAEPVQQGAGKRPVIGGGGKDAIGCQFNESIANPDRLICCALRQCGYAARRLSLYPFGERCRERRKSASLKQPTPINCH